MIGKIISHYKLLERLGQGGMGVIYKAQDLNLDRFVALKFMPAHLRADEEEKKRFTNEAKAASALEHPNICTIYEADATEDGQMFMAMAYYEGETLKQKVARGKLQTANAVDIAMQMAQGLARAHEAGIIHRDIKSANIMITTRGEVKIVDFGLAQLAGQMVTSKAGTTMGTPAYMSPEQARGEAVDHRADIWSLSVVLYEMVTGQLPFSGEYEQAVVHAILNENPPPINGLHPEMPLELKKIINKGLARKASARYRHVEEMLNDLRSLKTDLESAVSKPGRTTTRWSRKNRAYWLAGIAGLLGLILMSAIYFFLPLGRDDAVISLAVLPFVNANANPETEYLGDGITESLINSLSQLPQLEVRSFISILRYKGKAIEPHAMGRELHVRAVLVGRVCQQGDYLSISAALVNAQDNSQLWGEKYNRKLADILAVQEDISQEITRSLRLRLSGVEPKRLTKRNTESAEGYQLLTVCDRPSRFIELLKKMGFEK